MGMGEWKKSKGGSTGWPTTSSPQAILLFLVHGLTSCAWKGFWSPRKMKVPVPFLSLPSSCVSGDCPRARAAEDAVSWGSMQASDFQAPWEVTDLPDLRPAGRVGTWEGGPWMRPWICSCSCSLSQNGPGISLWKRCPKAHIKTRHSLDSSGENGSTSAIDWRALRHPQNSGYCY